MSARRVHELENRILKAKQAYYYGGHPILTDAEYDALEDELRELDSDNAVLAMVGAPLAADAMLTKARHRIPMGSQSKVNDEAEFRTWYEKSVQGGGVHASIKGDGASAAAYYEAGALAQAISRGDGVEGEDITANAAKFKGLPLRVFGTDGIGFTGAVRFEVILTVADWTVLDPNRTKNPRNAGSGIMGRKNGQGAELLSCFAFGLDEQTGGQPRVFATESEKLERLLALGFQVIPNLHCDTAEQAIAYFQAISASRDALPFWIDGVVFKVEELERQAALGVTANRPKGQIAWKFDSKGAETTLLGYSISVGHTGALIPTAHLEPVEIGGTTVSNALLNNWDEIARLDVAVGDRVWLIKANDIIPKITGVRGRPESRQQITEPTQCPVCHSAVARRRNTGGDQGAILECQNDDCSARSVGKLKRWIKSLDIEGIGDVVRHALVEQLGIEDAGGLYRLREDKERLAALVLNSEKELRLGEKRAETILASIDKTRELTLVQFLGSLGIERLATRRVEMVIGSAGGALDTLADWRSNKLRDPDLAQRAGVPSLGALIQDSIDAQSEVIDHLLDAGVVISGTGVVPRAEQPGQTLCISGKLPSGKKKADYEALLSEIDVQLVDSVNEGLTYLVLADPTSASAKAKKARKLGVRLLSEDELGHLLSGSLSELG
jgi:DNA ligase (NAD+)